MNEQATAQSETRSQDQKCAPGPEAMCPMASMCSRLSTRPASRFLLMLPGVLLVLIGVAIAIQPQVLVWLAAAAAVLLGVVMLAMAGLVYRLAAKPGTAQG